MGASDVVNNKPAACYMACFTMAPVFAFPPVLCAVLRQQCGISYTLLGTLVLVIVRYFGGWKSRTGTPRDDLCGG